MKPAVRPCKALPDGTHGSCYHHALYQPHVSEGLTAGAWLTLEELPLPGETLSGDCKGLAFDYGLQVQISQSRIYTPSHFLLLSLTLRATVPLSTLPTAGPGARQLRTAQSLLKLLKLANPKPAYPGSPILFHGNLSKGSDCAGSSPVCTARCGTPLSFWGL